jgi:hypothetical protein
MKRQEFDGAQMNVRAVSRVLAPDGQGQHLISESQAARERGKQMGAGESCFGGAACWHDSGSRTREGGGAMGWLLASNTNLTQVDSPKTSGFSIGADFLLYSTVFFLPPLCFSRDNSKPIPR